ncbi:hypothetical protein FAZ19_15715 [Sphingobacterium alkalisoli]|uniref:Phage integrase SAM-like domain-containing protein n=1 Tax=Sphingobacterium alkalisoli TaxID=1874115 RepID=A0A4U0GZ54_9SPHI|nr:phage integrase SAM-like domain-containing protein [Sphingobacterium alkalisoli]TJY64024.1 hypothetical protein FAZ19_15715 [Sphingobacterium alkalisoli]GGH25311.1 hypothetical protein GCM10011418_33850 [Sphingobacterium alkalisoli]
MVKHAFTGKAPNVAKKEGPEPVKEATLLNTFDEFIKGFAKLVQNKKRSDGTMRHWRTTRGKVFDFLVNHYKKKDIYFAEIRPSFGDELYEYLTLDAGSKLSEPTAKGHIKRKLGIVKRIRKQIDKFELTTGDIGLGTN